MLQLNKKKDNGRQAGQVRIENLKGTREKKHKCRTRFSEIGSNDSAVAGIGPRCAKKNDYPSDRLSHPTSIPGRCIQSRIRHQVHFSLRFKGTAPTEKNSVVWWGALSLFSECIFIPCGSVGSTETGRSSYRNQLSRVEASQILYPPSQSAIYPAFLVLPT